MAKFIFARVISWHPYERRPFPSVPTRSPFGISTIVRPSFFSEPLKNY